MPTFPPNTVPRRSLVLGALLAASRPAGAQAAIRIGGTGSALAVLGRIAASFAEASPPALVETLPSLGTNGGLRALRAGVIQVAAIARPLSEAERASGLEGWPFAQTALAFGTHLASPHMSLSFGEVARIYADELNAWPDGTPIRVVRRPPTEADWAMLAGISPEMDRAVRIALGRPGLLMAISDQENAESLERVRGSFGLIAQGQVRAENRQIQLLDLNGAPPGPEALAAGTWPLVRTLHLVTGAATRAEARRFVEFTRGPEAADILARCGYLPAGAARA